MITLDQAEIITMDKRQNILNRLIKGYFNEADARDLLRSEESQSYLQKEWDDSAQRMDAAPVPFGSVLDYSRKQQATRNKLLRMRILRYAAAILIPLLSLSGIWFYYIAKQAGNAQGTVLASGESERSRFTLPDGSTVWLNNGSSIQFLEGFGEKHRDLTLTGEAYFSVTKDNIPFNVIASDIRISVLGTVFNVNAYYQNESIEATLVEGKIAFSSKQGKESDAQILKPGQKASWSKETKTTSITHVNPDFYTSWIEGKLSFDNQYLEKIIPHLTKKYDIPIQLDSALHKKFRYTLTIKDEDLEEVLALLQLTSSIEYKHTQEGIIITSRN